MGKTTVSVILPVYNVENYLRQSMNSVVNQTFRDIEIICVNDSSQDSSPEILKEYAQNDSRIRIVDIPHSGIGRARNTGLQIATGDYVIFWDPDDWFELNAIELMYNRISETGADFCICNVSDFDSETNKKLAHNYIRKPYPETDCFCINDCVDRIFQITSSNCWNRLIRRSFLIANNISFPEGALIEDETFSLLLLALAEKITLCNKRLIHYRANRPGSFMNNLEEHIDYVLNGYHECYRQLKERGLLDNDDVCRSFVDRICGLYLYHLKQYRNYDAFSKYYQRVIIDDFLFSELWKDEWEYLPKAAEYAKARSEKPEEYLLRRFLEYNLDYSVLKEKNNSLKRKLKKIEAEKDKDQSNI